jgi:trehalose synthase
MAEASGRGRPWDNRSSDSVDHTDANSPSILDLSGWERLKDQSGLIAGFAQLPASSGAHLVIAGPSTTLAAADSEERLVLAALGEDRRALPSEVRSRVHLVEVPMEDRDDNAAIVNAIQRFAAVVAHKPHQEGFGLSVAEAMWKARPIVASRVGGIPEQIVDGESGILVDPHDLAGFAESTASLLADEKQRSSMGDAARVRAVQRFSAIDHLADHLELIQELRGRPDLERGR